MVPDRTASTTGFTVRSITPSSESEQDQASESDQPAPALPDYESLDFKQMLAACPLDGIELTRIREFPRDTEFDPTD